MRETVEIMRYPVTLTPAPEGGYMVSFVDIPEALTQGETVAEAMEAAKDALLTAFDFYFEDNARENERLQKAALWHRNQKSRLFRKRCLHP